MDILKLLVSIGIAFFVGKAATKIKLPAILGWLVTGMILGPHLFGILGESLLSSQWYHVTVNLFECTLGLMIGTELIWKTMKSAGKQIFVTTLTESLGTFFVVTGTFGILFYFTDIPLYLSALFGAIALATAPAPSLSIVQEMRTAGPVTNTLIPMAALDDLVAALVFFSVIAFVSAELSAVAIPVGMIILLVFLPLPIGGAIGFITGLILKKIRKAKAMAAVILVSIVCTLLVGLYINNVVLHTSILNFMLMGMALSAVFANMITEKQLEEVMQLLNPLIFLALIVAILNLGAPLDYHLILGAGLYTVIYILSRALGKYFGAWIGAKATKAPVTVQKYLGFTLLPHSGVSLLFTGITVSIIGQADPQGASIIQGTIAAAAVINEIIAVFMAKKGFEWAGEFGKQQVQSK